MLYSIACYIGNGSCYHKTIPLLGTCEKLIYKPVDRESEVLTQTIE